MIKINKNIVYSARTIHGVLQLLLSYNIIIIIMIGKTFFYRFIKLYAIDDWSMTHAFGMPLLYSLLLQ